MLIVPLGFAGESAIYLSGSEGMSPLELAVRLTVVVATLAVVALLLGRSLAVRRP
jgi:hypothetical protein